MQIAMTSPDEPSVNTLGCPNLQFLFQVLQPLDDCAFRQPCRDSRARVAVRSSHQRPKTVPAKHRLQCRMIAGDTIAKRILDCRG